MAAAVGVAQGAPRLVREHEQWRREQVTVARRESGCYWGNYNAVLERYETARLEVRKRGRRLQLSDVTREDGCLTVQIQRTSSGLGAAPQELQDGSYAPLQVGPIPPEAYAPSTFRGERRRLCQTTLQMRVDAAGNAVSLPVWMHRPLPEGCRVKRAQLTWRGECGRRVWRLCLTISRPRVERWHPHPHALALVRIDISAHGTGLRVARIEGSARHDIVALDRRWLRLMRRVEKLAAVIGNEAVGDRARIRARLERPGLWRRLLLRRREQYRLVARDLAAECGRIVIETPALSEAAWTERNTDVGKLRHLACAHELIAELRHQAAKHGSEVELRIAGASGRVPRRVRNMQATVRTASDEEALASAGQAQ